MVRTCAHNALGEVSSPASPRFPGEAKKPAIGGLLRLRFGLHLLRRATFVPSFPDQPSLTLAWQSRLHSRARLSAIFTLFFLGLLMITEVFETIAGG
jgi:hypothetical protein